MAKHERKSTHESHSWLYLNFKYQKIKRLSACVCKQKCHLGLKDDVTCSALLQTSANSLSQIYQRHTNIYMYVYIRWLVTFKCRTENAEKYVCVSLETVSLLNISTWEQQVYFSPVKNVPHSAHLHHCYLSQTFMFCNQKELSATVPSFLKPQTCSMSRAARMTLKWWLYEWNKGNCGKRAQIKGGERRLSFKVTIYHWVMWHDDEWAYGPMIKVLQ